MEVQILCVNDDKVCVSSSLGSFSGKWCSSTPEVGKHYIVELDSDDILALDHISLSETNNHCIENDDNYVYLTGLVEQIQDNVVFLRLSDSIVMLDLSLASAFYTYIGSCVKVRLTEIKLYDVGII